MIVRRLLTTLILVVGMVISLSVSAQVGIKNKVRKIHTEGKIELSTESVEVMNKTPKFAMGVSTARRLQSALMMYETLKNNNVKFKNYEILIWGQVVSELRDGSEWHEMFKEILEDKRIKVSVCAFAMKKLKLDEKELIPGMIAVPDAFSRVYELQALGYNVLIP